MADGKTGTVQQIYAKDASEWRAWLRKNHKTAERVFLVYYKKATGKPSVTYREALMEAICFGWIDTTVKRVDDERYGTNFVKRKPSANWSTNTLGYAEEMIRQKRMSKQGLEAYRRGKQKKPLDRLPKDAKPPAYMVKALKTNAKAWDFFDKMAQSSKLIYISWVISAKRPETRERRLKELVERCAQHKKWGD